MQAIRVLSFIVLKPVTTPFSFWIILCGWTRPLKGFPFDHYHHHFTPFTPQNSFINHLPHVFWRPPPLLDTFLIHHLSWYTLTWHSYTLLTAFPKTPTQPYFLNFSFRHYPLPDRSRARLARDDHSTPTTPWIHSIPTTPQALRTNRHPMAFFAFEVTATTIWTN